MDASGITRDEEVEALALGTALKHPQWWGVGRAFLEGRLPPFEGEDPAEGD